MNNGLDTMVFDFPVSGKDRNGFVFLTDVSIRFRFKGDISYASKEDITEEAYHEAELLARKELNDRFIEGNYRRLNEGSLLIPIERFYEREVSFEPFLSLQKGRFHQGFNVGATALGYVQRMNLIRAITQNGVIPRVHPPIPDEFYEIGMVETLDFGNDEIQRLLEDSGEEAMRANGSTCGTRGEHPSSYFLTNQDGSCF